MQIPLSRPDITTKERRAVMDVLRTPHLSLGPKIDEFEKEGARFAGRKYAVAVNSGTSALHLIMRALHIGKGDEVITTPFSFVASANCALFVGARPVFVDIEEHTLNISPEKTLDVIKKRGTKRIKAIVAVDVFGHPAEWDGLYRIARRHHIKLIEDSCEALGSSYCSKTNASKKSNNTWRKAGSFGDASAFAFYPNKQITTGEGGLILTDSNRVYTLCRSMRNQGRADTSQWLNHVRLGYNYRISDINCALGIVQFKRIKEIMAKRQRVAGYYSTMLQSVRGISLPYCASNVELSWFVYVIRLKKRYTRKQRDIVIERLKSKGIACSNYFSPIHLQPFYKKMFGYKRGDFPITESVADRTIALPFYNNLKIHEIAFVAENLKEILASVG